jgi:cob(I)alamin adenosyltransferase
MSLPSIDTSLITDLENAIDLMDEQLPALKNFILPGGHIYVSYCHIARCVCRRTERLCVHLNDEKALDDQNIIVILNRLSDYLFTLARYIGFKLHAPEIPWNSK